MSDPPSHLNIGENALFALHKQVIRVFQLSPGNSEGVVLELDRIERRDGVKAVVLNLVTL